MKRGRANTTESVPVLFFSSLRKNKIENANSAGAPAVFSTDVMSRGGGVVVVGD